MDIIRKEIMDYAAACTSTESDALIAVNEQISGQSFLKQMLSGHFQVLLSMLSKMCRPNRILEIGTFTGYSAICLAEGLTAEGRLTTIEYNSELEADIVDNLTRAGIRDKINLLIGDALQIIPTLNEEYDIIFIDADKKSYLDYYKLLLPKLSPGGLMIVDNVLWNGKVADLSCTDKETVNMRTFNDFVRTDDRVTRLMLPVRDGLYLLMKNKPVG